MGAGNCRTEVAGEATCGIGGGRLDDEALTGAAKVDQKEDERMPLTPEVGTPEGCNGEGVPAPTMLEVVSGA